MVYGTSAVRSAFQGTFLVCFGSFRFLNTGTPVSDYGCCSGTGGDLTCRFTSHQIIFGFCRKLLVNYPRVEQKHLEPSTFRYLVDTTSRILCSFRLTFWLQFLTFHSYPELEPLNTLVRVAGGGCHGPHEE